MFDCKFIKIEDQSSIEDILKTLATIKDSPNFNVEKTTIMYCDLDFYPGHELMEIGERTDFREKQIFAIRNRETGNITLLDWTNEPIYLLNREVPISLNKTNATNYARFFFNYTRGRNGKLSIVENVDDIDWKEDLTPASRRSAADLIQKTRLIDIFPDSPVYYIKSTVLFKETLFEISIQIEENGDVKIRDKKTIAENIYILDEDLG